MKRLRIIVPKESALDSYLSDVGFIYEKIVPILDCTCYTINVTDKNLLIKFLISKFSPQDYSIRYKYGEYIFRVRS